METKLKFDLATVALDDAYRAFWQSRKAKNVSKATMVFYHATVARFLSWAKEHGACTPDEITTQVVDDYLSSLQDRRVADGTLHAHARAIRTLLIFMHENELMLKAIKVNMPKIGDVEHQVLSAEEINSILDACLVPRDQAIVSFMLDTGARRQEVANLRWEDIDLEHGSVHIIRGKGRKSRWVGISPVTIRYLVIYRNKSRAANLSPEYPVFITDEGDQMSGETLRLLFDRLSKRAGFHVKPHALRHTYATNANADGMSLHDIQLTMGHAESTTTERYIKTLPSQIVERQIEHSLMMKIHRKKR
jgi:site-specific recombinase XerD